MRRLSTVSLPVAVFFAGCSLIVPGPDSFEFRDASLGIDAAPDSQVASRRRRSGRVAVRRRLGRLPRRVRGYSNLSGALRRLWVGLCRVSLVRRG